MLQRERDKNTAAWGLPHYASFSPGEHNIEMFLNMTQATSGSVLDAGAGSGKGALALHAKGFTVTMCDLTPGGLVPEARALPFIATALWHDLEPVAYLGGLTQEPVVPGFDYVYCCDVMEHIPEAFTMLAVRNMLAVSHRGLFLSISTLPDQLGVWVGETLHQTVKPFTWWRDALRELGTIVECRDRQNSGVYLVTAR